MFEDKREQITVQNITPEELKQLVSFFELLIEIDQQDKKNKERLGLVKSH